MKIEIHQTAENYQSIARKIKDLESKLKPLKTKLIDYAKAHKSDFDEAFQLKFKNGTYISHRVSDCIEGNSKSKDKLLQEIDTEYVVEKLDEKVILVELNNDNKLRKLLTKHDLKVAQKESFAVYAG